MSIHNIYSHTNIIYIKWKEKISCNAQTLNFMIFNYYILHDKARQKMIWVQMIRLGSLKIKLIVEFIKYLRSNTLQIV